MNAEVLSNLRHAEDFLDMPIIAPGVVNDPVFEFSTNDFRLGVIRRIGEVSLIDGIDPETGIKKEDRNHLHFLYNLESYLNRITDGETGSHLREHQHNVFEDIYDFLVNPPTSESGMVQRRGYVELPTGSGKTAIFSTLVDTLNRPLPGTDNKPKALVLVPKLDLVAQTVGADGKRGFAQFAQDTEVSEYHGKKKDLSGDAVVMSYQSLLGAVDRGDVTCEDFDLIICDEAHRALGEKTRAAIEQIAGGKLMLGLTASPEFKNRHVKDLFSEQIHTMDLREAIEMNLLSPVQCFAIASDAEIESLKSGEFSEIELAHLIENEWRNRKAVEFAKAFVENGKSGIISCVPGEDTKHASDIAESICHEFVEDKLTGELRRIRAVAVSGTTEDRQAIYDAFERGDIDVLTYVDVLTEGWDSTRAKFLINLRPTTSPVNAIQRLGRVLRKSEDDDDTAVVVEFIDKTDKQLYTFFHVLGEETIEQGKVIGSRNEKSDLTPATENGERNNTDLELPEELLEKLALINHVTVRELLLQSNFVPKAGEEIVSLNAFARSLGIGSRLLKKVLQQAEIDPPIYKFGARTSRGLNPNDQILVRDLVSSQFETLDDHVMSVNELAKQLKIGQKTLRGIVADLGLELQTFKFGARLAPGITPDQQAAIKDYATPKIGQATETAISINTLMENTSAARPKLLEIIADLGLELQTFKFGARLAPGITPDQQAAIMAHPYFSIKRAPDEVLSIKQTASYLGVEPKTIRAIVDQMEIELVEYRFGNNITPGIDAATRTFIEQALQASR